MDVGWRSRFKAPWGVGGGWGDREIERRERVACQQLLVVMLNGLAKWAAMED